jgi:hypothetical protein
MPWVDFSQLMIWPVKAKERNDNNIIVLIGTRTIGLLNISCIIKCVMQKY